MSVASRTVLIVRVRNFYPNGNRQAYGITPTFVDTVAADRHDRLAARGEDRRQPLHRSRRPVRRGGARRVRGQHQAPRQRHEHGHPGGRGVRPHDAAGAAHAARAARAVPQLPAHGRQATSPMVAGTRSRSPAPRSRPGRHRSRTRTGHRFETEIEWLAAAGITRGCSAERFCPRDGGDARAAGGLPDARLRAAAERPRLLPRRRGQRIRGRDQPHRSRRRDDGLWRPPVLPADGRQTRPDGDLPGARARRAADQRRLLRRRRRQRPRRQHQPPGGGRDRRAAAASAATARGRA